MTREEIQQLARDIRVTLPVITSAAAANATELAVEVCRLLDEKRELESKLGSEKQLMTSVEEGGSERESNIRREVERLRSVMPSSRRPNEVGIRGALEDVNKFHRAVPDSSLQDIGDETPGLTRRVSRWKLLKEEVDELSDAIMENDVHGVADAYADIIYIALGSAIMQIGAERFARVWDEVQRANMDKVSDSGKVIRREDGKILKPEGWRAPDIEKAFKTQKELSTRKEMTR